jgi:hypothetical protein
MVLLDKKLSLLRECVSVALSANSAFGSTTLPNYIHDDDRPDIGSWDRQARELLQQNVLLFQSIDKFDFNSYEKSRGIDAGSKGQSAKRKEFHQYCFDSCGYQKDPVGFSVAKTLEWFGVVVVLENGVAFMAECQTRSRRLHWPHPRQTRLAALEAELVEELVLLLLVTASIFLLAVSYHFYSTYLNSNF